MDQQTQTVQTPISHPISPPRVWYYELTEYSPPFKPGSILRAVLWDTNDSITYINYYIWSTDHWIALPTNTIVLDYGLREITKLEFTLLTGHRP